LGKFAVAALVTVYDAEASVAARSVAPQLRYAASAEAALRTTDVALHLTERSRPSAGP
jgi:UDPglucose 6-dehydrogenase